MGRAVAVALVVAACSTQPPPPEASLETIDSLSRSGDPAVVKAGARLEYLSDPYPALQSGTGLQSLAAPGLTVFAAFAEGQPAAYLTTEVWEDYERIWLQPLYVAVPPPGSSDAPLPVFGVGAGSAFYAPYWQVYNYTPIPGVQFKTEREVFDSGVRLTAGAGAYYALTDDAQMGIALQEGDSGPVRPLTGTPVGQTRNGVGYVDGHLTHYIDLGAGQRFTWNYETLVVDETQAYEFAREGLNQEPIPVDLPRVLGSGPLHQPLCDGHGDCRGVADGVPQFGGLFRLSTVLLPPGADVYVRPLHPKLRAAVQEMGFPAGLPDQDLGDAFSLRIAVNGAQCLGGQNHVAECNWLDSQNAIEAALPDARVTKTEYRVAYPLVLFNGNPLPLKAP
jgi:hypothetical protein